MIQERTPNVFISNNDNNRSSTRFVSTRIERETLRHGVSTGISDQLVSTGGTTGGDLQSTRNNSQNQFLNRQNLHMQDQQQQRQRQRIRPVFTNEQMHAILDGVASPSRRRSRLGTARLGDLEPLPTRGTVGGSTARTVVSDTRRGRSPTIINRGSRIHEETIRQRTKPGRRMQLAFGRAFLYFIVREVFNFCKRFPDFNLEFALNRISINRVVAEPERYDHFGPRGTSLRGLGSMDTSRAIYKIIVKLLPILETNQPIPEHATIGDFVTDVGDLLYGDALYVAHRSVAVMRVLEYLSYKPPCMVSLSMLRSCCCYTDNCNEDVSVLTELPRFDFHAVYLLPRERDSILQVDNVKQKVAKYSKAIRIYTEGFGVVDVSHIFHDSRDEEEESEIDIDTVDSDSGRRLALDPTTTTDTATTTTSTETREADAATKSRQHISVYIFKIVARLLTRTCFKQVERCCKEFNDVVIVKKCEKKDWYITDAGVQELFERLEDDQVAYQLLDDCLSLF